MIIMHELRSIVTLCNVSEHTLGGCVGYFTDQALGAGSIGMVNSFRQSEKRVFNGERMILAGAVDV
jgi:hypothetical protein